jgi:mycothiol system anti-sigma-R factor
MTCIESVARLHLYIDRELSSEEVSIVQQHLSNCSSCECRFHFDMKIKRLIHERCTIERAPAHLREAVLRLARTPANEPIEFDREVEMEIRADIEECE